MSANREDLEIEKIRIEIEEIRVKINKMFAETGKISKETTLYPLVVGASLMVAGGTAALGAVAIAKLYL